MTRTAQNLEINNFSAGLNTEASPLDYPPNSSIDEQNLVLNKDGSRSRRNGLKREYLVPIPKNSSDNGIEASNLFLNNIKISPSEGLIQGGYEAGSSQLLERSVSAAWSSTSFPLLGGIAEPSGKVNNSMAFTADTVFTSNGDAVGAQTPGLGDRLEALNLADGRSLTFSQKQVKVRDLWGSYNQSMADKEKERWFPYPAQTAVLNTDESSYVYNLYNSTFPARYGVRNNSADNSSFSSVLWSNIGAAPTLGDYLPALTDNFWLYALDTASSGQIASTGAFVQELYRTQPQYADLSAIKGRFVISPFRRSQTRVESFNKYVTDAYRAPPSESNPDGDISALENGFLDLSTGVFDCVTGHLGRIWTTARSTVIDDVRTTPDIDSLVFFSQTVKVPEDATKMHSEISPSSEDYEGDLATDGGFVTISGMSKCTALIPLDRSLMVFSPEGVWQIDGGEENFSATNVQVTKLSEIGTSFARSVVSTGQAIYYWGEGGIYRIVQNDVSLKGVANNISYTKVNRLVEEVEFPERISGIFDVVSQECRWVFCEKGKTTVDRQCSSELVFDTVTEAFSINRFPTGSQYPQMLGYVPIERYRTTDSDRGTSVALVGVSGDGNRTGDSGMQYEFYTYTNEDYLDYDHIAGGVDASAYMLGGFITAADSQRKKQVGYVTCSFKRTEDGFIGSEETGWEASNPSSCFMQSQWGWTSSATTGKWGRKQQVYRLPRLYVPDDPATDDWSNFGYEVINSRSKVRGMGKALSILFESEPGKNFRLYGWGSNASIADSV